MGKIKVIIKRPDEKYGHICHISPSLENLQKTVGGYIETVDYDKFCIICNEDGRRLGLESNMSIGWTTLVGTIIVAGVTGENLSDAPMSFDTWKRIVDKWGK